MRLLGPELQLAGVAFTAAKATHRADGGICVTELVARTQEDVGRFMAWCTSRTYPVEWSSAAIRVATPEEIKKCDEGTPW